MGLKNYIKRAYKFIIKGEQPRVTKVEVFEKTSSEMMQDKVVLITGGGSGLGYYMARKFILEGAKVIITGRNEEKLKKAQEELGSKVSYYVLDVCDVKASKEVMADIYREYKKVDCLINNAGISMHEGHFLNVSEEGFDKQFATNLKGAYFLSQHYINAYKEANQESGQIIFITSERGSQCDDIPYGLTKVAVNSLIEGLARRFYKDGIRVNGIAPGVTASEMTNVNKDDNLYCHYNFSERYFVPEEVAEAVMFLASDNSKCVNGEIIHCDAGDHLNPWFKK